jgi:hypothetical protein
MIQSTLNSPTTNTSLSCAKRSMPKFYFLDSIYQNSENESPITLLLLRPSWLGSSVNNFDLKNRPIAILPLESSTHGSFEPGALVRHMSRTHTHCPYHGPMHHCRRQSSIHLCLVCASRICASHLRPQPSFCMLPIDTHGPG